MLSSAFLGLVALVPSVLGAVLDVQVGPGGTLTYDPPFVHGAVGDTVRFHFNPKNHTVTQGTFDPPCVPVEGGFGSGFIPVPDGTTPLPTFEVNINDTTVTSWVYCGQVGHCGAGMVFAINPPTDPSNPQTFEAYRALAIARNGTTTTTSAEPTATEPTATGYVAAPTRRAAVAARQAAPPTGKVHMVSVGKDNKLTYDPATVTAAVGDVVRFQFMSGNHTVTQSAFINPCSSINGGFRSGFRPVASGTTDLPTFDVLVNNTDPIWGYCGQTGHCTAGMVFAINPPESGSNTFDAFQDHAMGKPAGTDSTGNSGALSAFSAPNFVAMSLVGFGAVAALL